MFTTGTSTPTAEAAGRVDHVLGDDVALLGEHLPFAARSLLHVEDAIVAHDGGAAVACADRQRVGGAGGIGVPVAGGVGAHNDTVEIEQRVQRRDLGGADEMALGAHVVEHALDLVEPVDLVFIGGKPDGAASVPAGCLAGFLLQHLVELGAVQVHLGHVEVADEVRNESGGVPCGAGGELSLLHQHDIRPPLLGQVVGEPHPHDAAADDDHTGLVVHGLAPSRPSEWQHVEGDTDALARGIEGDGTVIKIRWE